MDPKPSKTKTAPVKRPWLFGLRWPLSLLLLAGLVCFTLLKLLETASLEARNWRDKTLEVATDSLKAGESIPEKFRQGTITKTFISAMPTIEANQGGLLELATSQSVETFIVEDKRTLAWDMISLGTTTSEIKVPVTYRYHVRLSDDWLLSRSEGVCLVFAPPIRPSLPPAIHTDRMEKKASSGWARFNAESQLEELERSLTPRLSQYASDPQHMNPVRETCRKTLAEFIRQWLLDEGQWGSEKLNSIQVVFPDEMEQFTRKGSDAIPSLTLNSP